MKKFELGVYAFPGGTSYCNRAVMKNGDYKELAFVDYMGKVEFYTDPSLIPGDVLLRIEHDSSATAENFKITWNKQPDFKKYDRLADMVSIGGWLYVSRLSLTGAEKIDFMEWLVFGWVPHSPEVAQAVEDYKNSKYYCGGREQ